MFSEESVELPEFDLSVAERLTHSAMRQSNVRITRITNIDLFLRSELCESDDFKHPEMKPKSVHFSFERV